MKIPRHGRPWPFRLFLSGFAVALFGCQPTLSNELAVGERSRINDYIDVPISPLSCFNYQNKNSILAMRSYYVMRTPQLLFDSYHPDHGVFSQIEDGKPWWGMRGSFVFGSGVNSMEGDSEEARYLLNPYLLVGVNSWSAEIWDTESLNDADMSRADFPFCWQPTILRYHPRRQTIQTLYNVSQFDQGLATLKDKLKDKETIRDFGLVAYNARDFGYRFMYVPIDQSVNITNAETPRQASEIQQYIHCGGSCGLAGGCNNMSPSQPAIDHLKIEKLPATARVLLWKSRPASLQQPADMTMIIEFK